jgi:Fe2+ or Zn2+ uptake regulation protein
VIEAVRQGPHAGVDKIVASVAARLGSVSKQAVYDALEALVAARLVRRIEPAGSPALYENRVGDNHHHVVCRMCRAIDDVDCAHGDAPCLEPSQTHGFVIDEAEVTYWGVCPDCQALAAQSATATDVSDVSPEKGMRS